MKNILILNISISPSTVPDEQTYTSDVGDISGVYTNDAPAKYIIKSLFNSGYTLDRIVCVTTKEAQKAYMLYRSMIENYCSSLGCAVPDIREVTGSFEGNNIAAIVRDVLAYIENDDRIYIDTTGGARNSSYMLMFMTRFLEYEGIRLEKAVYSVLDKNNSANNKITDVTELYNMFDLINAANTFTSFGNADELAEVFRKSDNQNIISVINALTDFADSVTLCQTNLSEVLERLNHSLSSVIPDTETDDPREILFCRIVDVIRRKFNITDSKPDIDYPDIIRWCIDNNLIQQAITIYSEKIPEYLYRKKYFIPSDKILEYFIKKLSCYSLEYELFYKGLLNTIPNTHIIKAIQIVLHDKIMTDIVSKSSTLMMAVGQSDELRKLIQPDAKLQSDFTTLFKVKNAMFGTNGARLSAMDIERNFNQNPELRSMKGAAKLKSGVFSGYMKELCTRPDIQKLLFKKTSEQTYIISHFEEMLCNNEDFRLSDDITVSNMKDIINDSLYIKKWIRNVVNHAADESDSGGKLKEYFESLGYSVSDSFRVSDIKKIITEALDKLTI